MEDSEKTRNNHGENQHPEAPLIQELLKIGFKLSRSNKLSKKI